LCVKNVAEHFPDELGSVWTCIEWQPVWLMQKAERTQVVDPEEVVGVSMGVQHRIQAADIFADCLFAEIRRGIDQNRAAAVFNEYGWPGAPVARIGRMADRAIATDGRHAHGRAAPQHGERSLHFAAGTCCAPLA